MSHARAGSTTDDQQPTGASSASAVAIYPGPEAASFSAFHFPATVDHRVVRVNGVVTFVLALFAAAFAGRDETEWLVSGSRKRYAHSSVAFCSGGGGGRVLSHCMAVTGTTIMWKGCPESCFFSSFAQPPGAC